MWAAVRVVQSPSGMGDPRFAPKWAAILPTVTQLVASVHQLWSPAVIPSLLSNEVARWVLAVSGTDFAPAAGEPIEDAVTTPPPASVLSLPYRLPPPSHGSVRKGFTNPCCTPASPQAACTVC